jgi:hypothetical protein
MTVAFLACQCKSELAEPMDTRCPTLQSPMMRMVMIVVLGLLNVENMHGIS